MTSLFDFVNRLLPFATPGTPIIQDLLHLIALCVLLYFAPQLQEWLNTRKTTQEAADDQQAQAQDDPIHDPPAQNVAIPQEPAEQAQHPAEVNEPDREDDQNGHIPEGEAGPAREPRDGLAPRNIGAKKAKSLARRDQRRAYHEFQRSQGEMQRARDAEGAAEREAALAAERGRRRAAEAALEAKKAKEREQRRENERRERELELKRRELVVNLVREPLQNGRMCDLFKVARQAGSDVDEEWVEQIVRSSGILDQKSDGSITTITSMGWVVRVTAQDMRNAYEIALTEGKTDKTSGTVSYEKLGEILQALLTA